MEYFCALIARWLIVRPQPLASSVASRRPGSVNEFGRFEECGFTLNVRSAWRLFSCDASPIGSEVLS